MHIKIREAKTAKRISLSKIINSYKYKFNLYFALNP